MTAIVPWPASATLSLPLARTRPSCLAVLLAIPVPIYLLQASMLSPAIPSSATTIINDGKNYSRRAIPLPTGLHMPQFVLIIISLFLVVRLGVIFEIFRWLIG